MKVHCSKVWFTAMALLAIPMLTHAASLDDAMKTYKLLQCAREGAVLVAKFYNPPTNLMNAPMVAELSDLLTKVEADEATRVLVFTGGVPTFFIQHYDVGELDSTAAAIDKGASVSSSTELHATHRAYLQIEELSKPVIAAINGQAHGGGFELALACDFRILTNPGSVGLPEANVGIIPGAGGTVRLPRLIGAARAKELMMQGLVADAETAERYGMVMKAVPPDQLMPEAMKLAARLASLPPLSMKNIKKVVNTTPTLPIRDALRIEEDLFWENMGSDEAKARMRAYVESTKKK